MTALEKFAAILEEIQKSAAAPAKQVGRFGVSREAVRRSIAPAPKETGGFGISQEAIRRDLFGGKSQQLWPPPATPPPGKSSIAEILREVFLLEKEAIPNVPRGGRRMVPGWLGTGKPMSPTSPTRFVGAERGVTPPTKVEAMTGGLSQEGVGAARASAASRVQTGERLKAIKELAATKVTPPQAQPAMPGKVVRPSAIPKGVWPKADPSAPVFPTKIRMEPATQAEKRTQEALGEFVGRGAQAARKVKAAPTIAIKERVPSTQEFVDRFRTLKSTTPTSEALAVQLGQKPAVKPISPEAVTKKRTARALEQVGLGKPKASTGPTFAEVASQEAAEGARQERIRGILAQRAFEAGGREPRRLPKYTPEAMALGRKAKEVASAIGVKAREAASAVGAKAKEVAALPGKMVAASKAKAEGQLLERRQALKAEISRRMSWGSLEPKARYQKPGLATT